MIEPECKVRIEEIQVGERHRRDLGDVDGLAASIEEVELLHPVVLTPEKKLIAGQRRLEAVRRLKWTEVPVRVVRGLDDVSLALRAERDENDCRKPFNPVEAVALGRKLEEFEKAAAKERQAQAGPVEGPGTKASGSGNFPDGSKGEVRDRVGAAVGMSGRTYEKAKAVVEAAEREPEKYRQLVERMDQSGKVDGAFRELKKSRESELARPARKRRHKEDIKSMLDKLIKKATTIGEMPPLDVRGFYGEKGRVFALKLGELARVLDLWAKAITPSSEEPK